MTWPPGGARRARWRAAAVTVASGVFATFLLVSLLDLLGRA
jgi:hypothetical protein